MRSKMKGRVPHSVLLAGLLFFFVLAYPCLAQQFEPQLPDPGRTSLSRAQQEQLGFKAAQQVYRQMPVLPDSSPETQYVRKIGSRLVAVIPPAVSWPYQFHVVAEKDINAFALPGGEMFINLGAIAAAADEAQLAGVMAHEMSHVYMQHSAKQMQKSRFTQGLASIAGTILGDAGGLLGALGATGIQMGAGMMMLKYSRTDEAQADAVGAMILYRAGYNPMALADFFKTLEAQGGTPPQLLSDHPNPGNREEAIRKEIRNWPPERYRSDNAEFAAIRRQALRTKAYTSDQIAQGAKTGQWESLNRTNGAVLQPPPGMPVSAASQAPAGAGATPVDAWAAIAPSQDFVLTDISLARIARPRNWEIFAPQQQGQSITIAPRAGIVSSGVGCGVVINALTFTAQSMSLDQMTGQIVRSLEKGESGLQTVGGTSVIPVAGTRGRSVYMQSISPFSDAQGHAQKEKDQLVTIPLPGNTVVYLIFIAPEQDFSRLSPTFERMLQSVQF